MTPFLFMALVAMGFGALPWLSARSELLRNVLRYQFEMHISWPYAVRMLFVGPLAAIPIAFVALAVAVPHEDAGPLIIAGCLTGGAVLAIANVRPPRVIPRWLAVEIASGSVALPRRDLYDWAFFAFFEACAVSGILLVLMGANK